MASSFVLPPVHQPLLSAPPLFPPASIYPLFACVHRRRASRGVGDFGENKREIYRAPPYSRNSHRGSIKSAAAQEKWTFMDPPRSPTPQRFRWDVRRVDDGWIFTTDRGSIPPLCFVRLIFDGVLLMDSLFHVTSTYACVFAYYY